MSDDQTESDRAREVITDAIRLNLNRQAWTDRDEPAEHRSWINEFQVTAAIVATLEQAGIVLVELPQPEPREDDEVASGWEAAGQLQVTVWDDHPDEVRLSYDFNPFEPLSPSEARHLAAALLAAANRAEVGR